MPDETSMTDASDDPQRPRFKGCVFCYSGELVVYAAKKARKTARS